MYLGYRRLNSWSHRYYNYYKLESLLPCVSSRPDLHDSSKINGLATQYAVQSTMS
jgi:hypothetical protein